MLKGLAQNIKLGDTVINCFGQKLVVNNIFVSANDFIISAVDTGLNTHEYSYEDIYLEDLYGESDEEKSWVDWAKNNQDFISTFDHIGVLKQIYKQGFASGFEHRKQYSLEEMMQK
jgi:hypothetical protein